MKQTIEQLRARIDGLSLRERVMVFAAAVAVLGMIWHMLLMQPFVERRQTAQESRTAVLEEVVRLNQSLAAAHTQRFEDPLDVLREERAALRESVDELDARLRKLTIGLIAPEQMPSVLRELLRAEADVRLLGMESLPAEPLLADDGSETGLYRHGLRLELEGGFLAILAYLQRLESMPWRLIWSKLHLRSEEAPRNRATLTVHSLSTQEAWLGV